MSSTSEAIADSIAEQYSAAMDNAIDDAVRMESERDEARQQAAALRQANQELERRVAALALRLRTRSALIAALGVQELQGNTMGPLALLRTDYQDPDDDDVGRDPRAAGNAGAMRTPVEQSCHEMKHCIVEICLRSHTAALALLQCSQQRRPQWRRHPRLTASWHNAHLRPYVGHGPAYG